MQPDEVLLVNRIVACDRFGWTLDQVDALDPLELDQVLTVVDAIDKGRRHLQDTEAAKARRK